MIETPRLILRPLTYSELLMYLKNDGSLEKELNLNVSDRVISHELKEALEETILPHVADQSQNSLYSTLWTVILKEQNRMVGDLCFYGQPNEDGEIELGYGTYKSFEGRGYMTEAVGGIIEWAGQQAEVKAIVASTEKLNVASYTILAKNNFVKSGESETLFNWRLMLK
ncbi:MAG: GNAT family N-acetyltransferase [Lentimicrobium sp.]|nr:GNAT family N-acetyltransferase [Lentimicrobium sp.]